jgi:hypothetical protein
VTESPDDVIRSLSGERCSVVRASYGDQLVVGFGDPYRADWPLRKTLKAPWLLYTSTGAWTVSDGPVLVASDAGGAADDAVARIATVLVGQVVDAARVRPSDRALTVRFLNGAALDVAPGPDAAAEDTVWEIEVPGSRVVTATGTDVEVRDVEPSAGRRPSVAATVHASLRALADELGLALFEPSPMAEPAVDAVLVTPSGTVLLVQVQRHGDAARMTLSAVGSPSAGNVADVDVGATSELTQAVRRLVGAA